MSWMLSESQNGLNNENNFLHIPWCLESHGTAVGDQAKSKKMERSARKQKAILHLEQRNPFISEYVVV